MAHLSANCVHDFSTLRNHRVHRGVCGGRARGYRGRRRHSPPVRFAGRHGHDGSPPPSRVLPVFCCEQFTGKKNNRYFERHTNGNISRSWSRFIRRRGNTAYERFCAFVRLNRLRSMASNRQSVITSREAVCGSFLLVAS